MERSIRANAVHNQLVQRLTHLDEGRLPRVGKRNQFANQAVVVRGHGVAAVNVRVDANSMATWRMESFDRAR